MSLGHFSRQKTKDTELVTKDQELNNNPALELMGTDQVFPIREI